MYVSWLSNELMNEQTDIRTHRRLSSIYYDIIIQIMCVCVCVCLSINCAGGLTAGSIMAKFGTHKWIDLGMVPNYTLNNGDKYSKSFQSAGPIGTKFGTYMHTHQRMDIG